MYVDTITMTLAAVLLLLGISQICGRTVSPPSRPISTTTSLPNGGCGPGTNGCQTTTTETKPPGCDVDGVWYAPGQHYDVNTTCWRGGIWCFDDGHFQHWDDFTCLSTRFPTTELRTSRTTTLPTTERGCDYQGLRYPPGEIYSGRSGNWCYGAICLEDGTAYQWDNFECGSTTPSSTPPPTTYPTTRPPTSPPTTRPVGCVHSGRRYAPGNYKTGQTGNWCYGIICEADGRVLAWDDWECGSTLPSSTTPTPPTSRPTTPPTRRPTTRPLGCMYGGRRYAPGNYKTGQTGNWCYGIICEPGGSVIAWDDWECGNITMTSATSTQTHSRPKPFIRTTTPLTIFSPSVSTASRKAEMEAIRTIVYSIALIFVKALIRTLNLELYEFTT